MSSARSRRTFTAGPGELGSPCWTLCEQASTQGVGWRNYRKPTHKHTHTHMHTHPHRNTHPQTNTHTHTHFNSSTDTCCSLRRYLYIQSFMVCTPPSPKYSHTPLE